MTADYSSLDRLYANIPALKCKGKCQEACGPIGMSGMEWQRIKERAGARETMRTLACPYLNRAGRCDVYEIRPAICRLWGNIEAMKCPYGCVPDRYLTPLESKFILASATNLSSGAMAFILPDKE